MRPVPFFFPSSRNALYHISFHTPDTRGSRYHQAPTRRGVAYTLTTSRWPPQVEQTGRARPSGHEHTRMGTAASPTRACRVLQPLAGAALPALDVCPFGTRLVVSTPGRPLEDLCGRGRRLPDEGAQEPADFGHGQGQQLQDHLDAQAVGACTLLLRRPLFRCCA